MESRFAGDVDWGGAIALLKVNLDAKSDRVIAVVQPVARRYLTGVISR